MDVRKNEGKGVNTMDTATNSIREVGGKTGNGERRGWPLEG